MRSSLLMGALAVLAPQAAANSAANRPTDTSQIREIETSLYASSDAKRLARAYAPDAVVIDAYRPDPVQGTEQIDALLRARLAGVRSRVPNIRQMDIVASSGFACAAMQVRETTTMQDGRTTTRLFRHLDALRKTGDRWMIVQQHDSFPVDQKSGETMFDGNIATEPPRVWFPASRVAAAISPKKAETEIYQWMLSGTHTTSADQMMAWYAKDARIVLYDAYAPGYMRGPTRIRDYYAPMMSGFQSVRTEFPVFHAQSDGVIGGQIDTQILTVTTAPAQSKVYRLRQNDCVIRIGGKWKTFFEHISLPAKADAGKAGT